MAKAAPRFLFLLFVSLLTVCSSGTLVGFSYRAGGHAVSSSSGEVLSFLKLNKVAASQIRVFVTNHKVLSTLYNSGVSVDFYLNGSLVQNWVKFNFSAVSWLKTHVIVYMPHVKIKSIIVSGGSSGEFIGFPKVFSMVKSIHSFLSSLQLDNEVKVSAAFPLSIMENFDRTHEKDLEKIYDLVKKIRSFVIVETSIDGELKMGDGFVKSVIEKTTRAASVLPDNEAHMLLSIKTSAVPSAIEVAEFASKVSKSLLNSNQIRGKERVAELYAEVSSVEDFKQKELKREHEQIFPSSRRELNSFRTTLHDGINPPTFMPTSPITGPPGNPTPTIITVPATNPTTVSSANPASTPLSIPSTTPVTVPSANPVNPPVPITNPVSTPAPITVPGAQPITNPVTTYPAPAGNVPVTTPVTNPVAPPATTNAPAIPGQSWCVAKTGVMDASLQAALDYACGIGGADCSVIQQGGSCYDPNTLQNHASYAFNSYYQKNPVSTSCDFGGTAAIVNTNPSTGTCIYPSSSTPTSTPAAPTSTPTTPPTTTPTTTPATTTTTSPVGGVAGSVTPPTVLNSSNPGSGGTTVFGTESPPGVTSSTSMSSGLQPFIGVIILATSFIARIIILDA